MRRVQLAEPTDWAGFRAAARALVQAGVAPGAVHWSCASTAGAASLDLFAQATPAPDPPTCADTAGPYRTGGAMDASGLNGLVARQAAPAVPRDFLAECARVVLHRDPGRFALMYRLLWRHAHEPGLRHDPLDPDRQRARQMAHAVARDLHKMRAFVRFRPVVQPDASTVHVAWFEPEHHTVRANADFFMRRFAGMRWAVLTPECCLQWDGAQLAIGPGALASDAPPADAGEALWLTYYRHIFNPARLRLKAMEKEMPRRYWRNLPEARLIGALAQAAPQRSAGMVDAPPSVPRRRIVPLGAQNSPAMPTDSHVAQAVADAGGLPQLYAIAQACRACPIGAHATQAVPGAGPAGAQRMLVGEQPGDREDLQGQAFVGPAGHLLDRALEELGWPRGDLFLTNAVKHFKYEPRGKRRLHQRPTVGEMRTCSMYLDREIEIVRPRSLLALGATAAHALLGHAVKMDAVRGRWHQGVHGLPVLVAWHPSALLRSHADRDTLWAQWLQDLAAPLEQGG